MSKVKWSALMQLGLGKLRLTPEQFWALTPAELMLMAGLGDVEGTLSRNSFADLSARFPDKL